jgi:hypothetical protein
MKENIGYTQSNMWAMYKECKGLILALHRYIIWATYSHL